MANPELDSSIEFGQTEGLFVYNMARSLDGDSARPDQPIAELAEDAVRTAVRLSEQLGIERIDLKAATRGLIAVLDGNFESQT